eukprot:11510849-Prorocentrum_lima.AAC.1
MGWTTPHTRCSGKMAHRLQADAQPPTGGARNQQDPPDCRWTACHPTAHTRREADPPHPTTTHLSHHPQRSHHGPKAHRGHPLGG